jgi:hypothetical protein
MMDISISLVVLDALFGIVWGFCNAMGFFIWKVLTVFLTRKSAWFRRIFQ